MKRCLVRERIPYLGDMQCRMEEGHPPLSIGGGKYIDHNFTGLGPYTKGMPGWQEEQDAAIEELAELLADHTWGCGHCGGCLCDSPEAASERPLDWARHVARFLTEQGYVKVAES